MIFDGQPTVLGHRGFGAGAPGGFAENTPESFRAAVRHGLSWIELDVQRSRDGQLVLRHDPVTPDGAFVVTRTAAELAEAGVARFDEVLAGLPPGVGLDIDVKTIIEDAVDPPAERTGALLAATLRRHAGQRPLLVTSFDPGLLVYLQSELPEIPLGLLCWLDFPAGQAISAAAGLGVPVVSLHTGTFGFGPDRAEPAGSQSIAEITGLAHRAGLEVLVWTPDPAQAVTLARGGVDAVCVDDVPGTLAALAAAQKPGAGRV